VQQTGWLDERQFLVAVAIGMISPGPVVITATFVGAIVAGFLGSLVATVGIFLPSFLFLLIVAPILIRNPANCHQPGVGKGAYAGAIGTILGPACCWGRLPLVTGSRCWWHCSAWRYCFAGMSITRPWLP